MKTFAFVNQKGGVGKTTTVVNMAACLAAAERRVLLVDLDPQGNATSGLGIDKNKLKSSTYDVLCRELGAEEARVATAFPKLDLIPANTQLVGAELELVSLFSRETRLKQALSQLAQGYEYALIDCPPSLGLLTVNALAAADAVIVPVQAEYYAMEGLSELVRTIELIQRHLNPALQLEGIVLTMYDGRNNLARQVAEEVAQFFGDKLYTTAIARNVKLSECPSHGKPIILYDIHSKGAQQYLELVSEFVQRQEASALQQAV